MRRKGHIDPELVIGREGAGGEKGPAQSHDCCRMASANIRRYADPKLGWYIANMWGECEVEMTIMHCPWCGERLACESEGPARIHDCSRYPARAEYATDLCLRYEGHLRGWFLVIISEGIEMVKKRAEFCPQCGEKLEVE